MAELDLVDWPEGGRPGVRIGIHTGEADRWRSGYVGFGLIRALRVCDAGVGGQVLVSPTTETVVDGHDLAGVELRALPQRLLEDFERPSSCTRRSASHSPGRTIVCLTACKTS